ncbi:MAG TPA: selenocysteine-specific translation elongation factor [Terriglobales bacterium]|jgi:selenocysteine-specific elongation factor
MKSVIVGTAGHIDHGKTALVKALTGIDADRLEEEKRRGITIDIGFANLDLTSLSGEKLHLGFVDVPGHERFIRNMLAGVGGIDLVLLVIAADESIKPQTREHFDICRLLAVRRGITVLTKTDLVDAETVDVVKLEVEEYLHGSFLDPELAPVIPVSALTGAGLGDLKEALARVALETSSRDPHAITRLPIDRVFSMKGFGTVVTGTLVAGTIRNDDELEVFPSGRRVRIRGVQVHGESTDQAVAGQRTALNLAGLGKEDLARGMMLASPDVFHATNRIDTRLTLLPSAKPLKDGARVHFHAYTMETIARVKVHEGKQIEPGGEKNVRLHLDDATLLLPNDRFILRQFSPVITIGGGFILDASPLLRKQPATELASFLSTMAFGTAEKLLESRVRRRGLTGLAIRDIPGEMNIQTGDVRRLAEQAKLLWCGQVLVTPASFATATQVVVQTVEKFHDSNPLVSGISREELRERTRLSPDVFQGVMTKLLADKKLSLAGDLVHVPGRGVAMKDEETESKKTIEAAFASAGLKVPALQDVLGSLKVDKTRAQKIVTLLLRDRVLVKISADLVFHDSALKKLRELMAAQKVKSSKIDVAQFKDLAGVSRKYAIPLLEYLDRERVTKRVGDAREIL